MDVSSPQQSEIAGLPAGPLRALLVDDSENDALILAHTLRKAGYQLAYERVWTAPAMRSALQSNPWDIIISDYEMPGFGGFEALQLVKESELDIPFILVSAVVSEETAVAAMRAGAQDYIMKRKLARLIPAIDRELREKETRRAKHAAEEALLKSQEQLRQAQKLEAVARLAAGVAHDFNNILTAIKGHSELLLRQIEPTDRRRIHADQIEKCADMAATLTRQLLTFSRKKAVDSRVISLNEVVRNIERMLRRLIGEDVEFTASLDSSAGHVKADPGNIEQLVMNLAINARDAMPRGGKLTISTANITVNETTTKECHDLKPGKYAVLSVTDTGCGMADEVKAHLFEPFFTTKPLGKGTGLGLATCFGIVQQSSGCICVQSEPGKGTIFKILLPEVNSIAEPLRPAKVAADPGAGKETVLLVEDEGIIRELASTALRERGYTVLEAGNGEEGLRVAEQHTGKIDLVFTDVVMPAMGGKDMADALHRSRPDTKVLFTSGYTEDTITDRGVRQGLAFLQKPYVTATLACRVREVLDQY